MRRSLKFASPLEGEVGPQGRVGGNFSASPESARKRHHTPHPPTLRVVDLPLKGGGDFKRAARCMNPVRPVRRGT